MDHGTSVTLPDNNKVVVLIPESVPVYFLYGVKPKFPAGPFTTDKAIRVGSVGDVRAWVDAQRSSVRSWIDIGVSAASVVFGLLVEFPGKKSAAKSADVMSDGVTTSPQ